MMGRKKSTFCVHNEWPFILQTPQIIGVQWRHKWGKLRSLTIHSPSIESNTKICFIYDQKQSLYRHGQPTWEHTMWKFQDFFWLSDFMWNQFWSFWSFEQLWISHMYLGAFYIFKFEIFQKFNIQSWSNDQNDSFVASKWPELILRKIWVAEKSWNFHIVYSQLSCPGL